MTWFPIPFEKTKTKEGENLRYSKVSWGGTINEKLFEEIKLSKYTGYAISIVDNNSIQYFDSPEGYRRPCSYGSMDDNYLKLNEVDIDGSCTRIHLWSSYALSKLFAPLEDGTSFVYNIHYELKIGINPEKDITSFLFFSNVCYDRYIGIIREGDNYDYLEDCLPFATMSAHIAPLYKNKQCATITYLQQIPPTYGAGFTYTDRSNVSYETLDDGHIRRSCFLASYRHGEMRINLPSSRHEVMLHIDITLQTPNHPLATPYMADTTLGLGSPELCFAVGGIDSLDDLVFGDVSTRIYIGENNVGGGLANVGGKEVSAIYVGEEQVY